jgi:hypothetical protein
LWPGKEKEKQKSTSMDKMFQPTDFRDDTEKSSSGEIALNQKQHDLLMKIEDSLY